jgi:hypothetical protein
VKHTCCVSNAVDGMANGSERHIRPAQLHGCVKRLLRDGHQLSSSG